MTRTVIVMMALGTLLLTGCEDPCLEVDRTAPPEAVELMEQGYEVSRMVDEETECELQPNGRWERDA